MAYFGIKEFLYIYCIIMRQEVRLEQPKKQRTTDFDVFLLFDIV